MRKIFVKLISTFVTATFLFNTISIDLSWAVESRILRSVRLSELKPHDPRQTRFAHLFSISPDTPRDEGALETYAAVSGVPVSLPFEAHPAPLAPLGCGASSPTRRTSPTEGQSAGQMTLKEAKQYIKEGHFKKGSMLPKMEAVIQFLEEGGKQAIRTSPHFLEDAIDGKTGTLIVP